MALKLTPSHGAAAIPLLLIWTSLSVLGQGTGQGMPGWLAPFPRTRDQSAAKGSDDGTSSYMALAAPADVIAHYTRQMRAAGVEFKTQSDGIGVSIVASAEKVSAIVRIQEDDDVSKVMVSYSFTDGKALVPEAGSPQRQAAQRSGPPQRTGVAPAPKRAALSPYAHVPYTWAMQSTAVGLPKDRKYAAFYYEPATDRSVETPLTVTGASIVDVFPQDCVFRMQDQSAHALTFKSAEEAIGKRIGAGTWAVYPLKCGGIIVFLR